MVLPLILQVGSTFGDPVVLPPLFVCFIWGIDGTFY